MASVLNTKCSVCGGPLVFPAGSDVVICEYCLRPNARPKSEPTETSLMKYANERRNIGEFDEAAIAYRKVLQANIEEHEARWGLLLCKYGVMYVEDAAGKERLLTCRRAVRGSIQTEPDYRICCEQAGKAVRACYEKDAAYIDAVQAEIRRIRAEDNPYDIFICYKETSPEGGRTRDSVFAQQIYGRMQQRGYRVFYTPESLKQMSGANYEAAIFAALADAKVMVVVGTKREYFDSTWVRSEWKRYLEMIDAGEDKLLVPVYRDLNPGIDLPLEFRKRYLQALDMSDMGFMYDLEALMGKVVRSRQVDFVPEQPNEHDELLQALFLVEDGDFENAVTKLQAIKQKMPESAEVHLGLCMAFARIRFEEDLPEISEPLNRNPHFRRALRFAKDELLARLQKYARQQQDRFAKKETGRVDDPSHDRSRSNDDSLLARAERGDAVSQINPEPRYDNGQAVQQDKEEAAKRFRKVSEPGGEDAKKRLQDLQMQSHGPMPEQQYRVGDTVAFGSYAQKGNNERQAIEWLVLRNDGKTCTLISKYGLDAKPYNTEYTSATWDSCTLRKWLNTDFLSTAFSAKEQARLATARVSADKNPKYSTNPGINTLDKVYLLSTNEVNQCFASDADRVCLPTQTAVANGAYTGNSGACWWWLRSPGYRTDDAALVLSGGSVYERGHYVSNGSGAVRPVVVLRLEQQES